MPAHLRLAVLAICAGPGLAGAQNLAFDGTLAFTNRDEVAADPDEDDDSDILRLTAGLTWSAGADGRLRGALEFGFGGEEENEYSGIAGGELVFSRKVGAQRYSLGARRRVSDTLSDTNEVAYIAEHLGQSFDLRGMLGLQTIADPDRVVGRDDETALFALGEAAWYVTEDFALSAGLMGDGDGQVYGLGAEFSPGGTKGLSFFVEYGDGLDEFREDDGYSEITFGIRIVPGGGTVRAARQQGLGRVMQRFVEVQ